MQRIKQLWSLSGTHSYAMLLMRVNCLLSSLPPSGPSPHSCDEHFSLSTLACSLGQNHAQYSVHRFIIIDTHTDEPAWYWPKLLRAVGELTLRGVAITRVPIMLRACVDYKRSSCADSQQAGWRLLSSLCGVLHSVCFSCFKPTRRSKGMYFTTCMF